MTDVDLCFLKWFEFCSDFGFYEKSFFYPYLNLNYLPKRKKNMGEGNFSITVFDNDVVNDKMFNMNYDLVSINDDKSFVYLKD